jgi:hypothetical protein
MNDCDCGCCRPLTPEEYQKTFGEYDAWVASQKAQPPYPHPDTEFDMKHDLSALNLPETRRENEEGFGVYRYE